MDHGDNKHCIETPWSDRYHYRTTTDNHSVACGIQDSPNRVQLRGRGRGYPTFDFEVPRQSHDLEKMETMLQHAYERGRSDNRQEVGKLMRDFIAI